MEINIYNNKIKELLKDSNIKLLSLTEEDNKYTLEILFDENIVKLTTDFKIFCFTELKNINVTFLNSKLKTPEYIFSILKTFCNTKDNLKKENKILPDSYHIHQKINSISKIDLNYDDLYKHSKILRDIKNTYDLSVFPKDLLFNPNQIFNILKKEMETINQNMRYKHIISPINNNIYELSLKLKLRNPIIAKIKEKFNYDYVEIKINIEPKMYPFVPPKLEFIKPSIKLPLIYNLMNLNILKTSNWIPTLSLEWLIIKINDALEPIIQDYLILEEVENSELEILLIKLGLSIKENNTTEDIIKIDIPKITKEINNDSGSKYWKAGTGYGHAGLKSINIVDLIKKQEDITISLSKLLASIYTHIKNDTINIIFQSVLPSFIIKQISGLTLLELGKNEELYTQIFNILNLIIVLDKTVQIKSFINDISNAFTNIFDEIAFVFSLNKETTNEKYILIHCLADSYKSLNKDKLVVDVVIKETNLSIEKEYDEFMSKKQFATFDIPDCHRFIDEKSSKLSSKATKKITEEITNFRKNLPLNWGSSIFVRISTKALNIFNFWITGPKNTPYENGFFEYHASYPQNYPETYPKVLLHTTGKGTIRFNPNLYKCGKVCLSLIGTWSGDESESWNPTSTMYQVLCSVQSEIMGMDFPYFNEPGYEKEKGTNIGERNNEKYNEALYYATVKFAINDMIKNPPLTMEEVIKMHFKMKKDEIIKTTSDWQNKLNKNLIDLINNLNFKDIVKKYKTSNKDQFDLILFLIGESIDNILELIKLNTKLSIEDIQNYIINEKIKSEATKDTIFNDIVSQVSKVLILQLNQCNSPINHNPGKTYEYRNNFIDVRNEMITLFETL
jgi:ubiquitin-protein ligase